MAKRSKRKASIRLSEKHGVNPTIPICFWCGNEKNEVALLGKLPNDEEAPRSMWIFGDYEPCDRCKENLAKGVDLIEACVVPVVHEDQPPIVEGVYPTGRHLIMTDKGIRNIFDEAMAEELVKRRKGFVDPETMETIYKMIDNGKSEEE